MRASVVAEVLHSLDFTLIFIMLCIRSQQLTVIDESSRQRLLEKLEDSIRSRHPDLVGDRLPPALRALLSAAIAAAKRHRIDYESHVYQFAVMFLALGADFEKRPDARWAVDILKSDLPPETRLFQLRETYLSRQNAESS